MGFSDTKELGIVKTLIGCDVFTSLFCFLNLAELTFTFVLKKPALNNAEEN